MVEQPRSPSAGKIPPVRRLLLKVLTALCLLLSLAVAALWVRSHFVQDFVQHDTITITPTSFRWWQMGGTTWKGVVSAFAIRHDYRQVTASEPVQHDYPAILAEAQGETARSRNEKWRSERSADWSWRGNGTLAHWGFTWQALNNATPGRHAVGLIAGAPCWFLLLLCSLPLDLRIITQLRRRRAARRGFPVDPAKLSNETDGDGHGVGDATPVPRAKS